MRVAHVCHQNGGVYLRVSPEIAAIWAAGAIGMPLTWPYQMCMAGGKSQLFSSVRWRPGERRHGEAKSGGR